MTTIHLNSEVDIESLMQGMGTLNHSELENVLLRIGIMLAQKKAPNLPEREATLLIEINQSPDESVLQRYASLKQRMQENTLSEGGIKGTLSFIGRAKIFPYSAKLHLGYITC